MKRIHSMLGGMLLLCQQLTGQVPYPSAPPPPAEMIKAEYYFDNEDPGFGNAAPISFPAAINVNSLISNIALTGSALRPGAHYLRIRTQNAAGLWSMTQSVLFSNAVMVPYPGAPAMPPPVTAGEYFIDTDPGVGNGIPLPITAAGNVQGNFVVSLSGVSIGSHWLYVRTRDANGIWSMVSVSLFSNTSVTPYPTSAIAQPLAMAEYFIDEDPGFGNGIAVPLPSSTDIHGLSINVMLTNLVQGPHTIYFRSKENPWSFTAYSDFVYGSTLPLVWLYVQGKLAGDDAIITWATASESNTDKFIIEYSRDGRSFVQAGKVAAAGNSSSSRTYTFTHPGVQKGFHFYRISQTDIDGKFTYSKIISLVAQDASAKALIAPNPARDMIHITQVPGIPIREVEVLDMKGRRVLVQRVTETGNVISLPVAGLAKGAYVVRLLSATGMRVTSFIKQ